MEKKQLLKRGYLDQPSQLQKKTTCITIIPIGIAYSNVNPKFRSKVSLSFGEPLIMNDYINLSINEFNELLYKKMTRAENEALKEVGR